MKILVTFVTEKATDHCDNVSIDSDQQYEIEYLEQDDQTYYEDIEYINIEDKGKEMEHKIKSICKQPVLGKVKGKTCIWNFFDLAKGENVYTCTFCSKEIAIFPKNVYNLRRHIKTCHTKEFEIIMKYAPPHDYLRKFVKLEIFKNIHQSMDESALTSDEGESDESNFPKEESVLVSLSAEDETQNEAELDLQFVEDIQNICKKTIIGRSKSKTCIWNFFKRGKDNDYVCMFCSASVKVYANFVSNLKRHLQSRHKKEYLVILSSAPMTDSIHQRRNRNNSDSCADISESFVKDNFDRLYNGSYLCKHCQSVFECSGNLNILHYHIQDKHLEMNQDLNEHGEIQMVIVQTSEE
ncbi:uncharacterized protein LOC135076979 [Ostrinia nubilalis]|uniref:uncharacterized protein LOC135076979 n=1 Tax=Ostrinia nubilalis TaxID=29057 RepID=UPI0030823F60